ncbi:MAG: ribokinase [Solirubrobacterales bacterium]
MAGSRPLSTDSDRPEHGGKVAVVGAINVDLVVTSPRLPGPGETVVGFGPERYGGGKGANAAVAAARAGARVLLVGAVGEDATGAAALAELEDEGVDVSGVSRYPAEATGVALIVVDPHGENQIAVGSGANGAIGPDEVRAALGRAAGELDCVLVSTEVTDEAVEAAVEMASAAGIPCVLNPAPPSPAVIASLERGPLLTPNATELEQLASMLIGPGMDEGVELSDPVAAADLVSQRTGAPVVVTLGGDGALVVGDGEPRRIPAPAAEVRDTTGAGDTFNGVLAARLASGDDLDRALELAIAAASLSVAEEGARRGMPGVAAIEAAATGFELR